MLDKLQSSRLFVSHFILFLFSFGLVCDGQKDSEEIRLVVNIGVVQDMKSPLGSMTNICIDMAISDFYSAHPNYRTRLQLHTKNAKTILDADFAVLELLENEQAHVVLGPQRSTEELFVTELGAVVHVPIISFTSRSSTFSDVENHFFVRTAQDEAVQAQAIATICQGFGWTEVVFFYEDTEYGYQFLSLLNRAFQDVEIHFGRLTPIRASDMNDQLSSELLILKKMQTRVFLVHMNPSLGFRLFNLAKKMGMMSEGYAWIITDSLSNFLNSMDSTTRDSMEGVVGIRPYVPPSGDLENFQEMWKGRISSSLEKKNGKRSIMDLNVYGLWAYDTITALAKAAEKIGPVNSSSLNVPMSTKKKKKHKTFKISSLGPLLLAELSGTKFKGLSGEFELVDGKLKPSVFEIFNVIGTGERRVGFWMRERGIIRELDSSENAVYSTSTGELKNIVWPGDSIIRPKGWAIPPSGTLRVGVPWKAGYKEFANAEFDPATNRTNATGFAVDIFKAALKELRQLPFPINFKYEFYAYNDTENINWTYDDMLRGIPQDFDMVVGDTTIWAPRASFVDFSLPYSESGVVLVVKNKKSMDMWTFIKPLKWDLWLAICVACIFMGIVIWILERGFNNAAPAEGDPAQRQRNQRLENIYLAPIMVLAFQERGMVSNRWSFYVLVSWLFMAFILMQSFTANLSAILTIDQLKFAFSEDYYLGYHEGSFMKKFLTENLNINEARLRGYSSVEGFHEAMSRGSKNGGIDAIFDEFPYMKLLVNRYDSQYKIVKPMYRTDGLGFAFPRGSPLVAYFSRAILNVTQGPQMTSIEQKNFGPGYSSQDPLSSTVSQGTSSLSFHDFAGLFIIVGSVTAFAVICSERQTIRNYVVRIGQFFVRILAWLGHFGRMIMQLMRLR